MPSGSGQIAPSSPTSPAEIATVTTTNGTNGIRERKSSTDGQNNIGPSTERRSSVTSHDPTDYVQRARTTRAAPPKPAANPMQFVKIKPCNLYQSAQEQLKRAEEVKKVKEVRKEDAEDWQCNLDNWKSSRRKRVEHIIDRVVEVKKLELEEHDRTRRKSKTFSEMLEERGTRRKMPLAVYNEDDANDLSDLGIGTSSASGKSSLSEDFDNHSVISDNQDTEKSHSDVDNNSNHENGNNRDYVSSPGYDTSSSTAPASSPDPCEYTYEGAIEGYKLRISRAQSIGLNGFNGRFSKDSTPERASSLDSGRSSGHENGVATGGTVAFLPKRPSVTKIEDRLINFELKSSSDSASEGSSVTKKDLPKVDVLKRREMFEKDKPAAVTILPMECTVQKRLSGDFSNAKSIKERLSSFEQTQMKDESAGGCKKANRLSGDLTSIKERLTILEKEKKVTMVGEKTLKVDVPVVSLKDRLTSLHSAVTASAKQEVSEPLVDELGGKDAEKMRDTLPVEADREDSGIHTSDTSCSQSQASEQVEEFGGECSEEKSAELTEETTPADVSTDLTTSTLVESAPVSPIESDFIPMDNCTVNHDDTLVPAEVTSNELFDENCATELTEQDTSVSVSDASQSLVCEGKLIIDVKHLVNSFSDASQDRNNQITKQSTVEEVEFEETDDVALLTPVTDIATPIVTLPLPVEDVVLVAAAPKATSAIAPQIEVTEIITTETPTEVVLPKNFQTPLKIQIEGLPHVGVETFVVNSGKKFTCGKSSTGGKSSSPSSPKTPLSPKSPTRSIIDFIRNNLLESPSSDTPTATFYVPLDSYKNIEESSVNYPNTPSQELPVECATEKYPGGTELATDSLNSEINSLLDEELNKLDQ